MTPGKIPDCRTLRWNGRKEDYERRVEDAVRSIPLATFSTVRGVTNISDKQLAETFRRLEDCGRIVNDQEFKLPGEYREGAGSALLRWVEHAVHGRIIGHFVKPGARDAGVESMTRPQHVISKVGIPPGSGGRLRAIDLLSGGGWPRPRTGILKEYRPNQRIGAGKDLAILLREGVLETKPIRTNSRGRPRIGIAPVAPGHTRKRVSDLKPRR